MDLVLGARKLDRRIEDAERLLAAYRTDDGLRYLDHVSLTPSDQLVPEDLAVTILINSRVGPAAFKSVQDRSHELRLADLPAKPLEETDDLERSKLAGVIARMAAWPGFAASVSTKILHKKRSELIPILDNQAIFGAYMSPLWPQRRSSAESVYAEERIKEALDWIWSDLVRSENEDSWVRLRKLASNRSLIEVFDMVWWMHFRKLEPVRPVSPI